MFCQLKPRERIVPKWHEKPYEWDQVSENQDRREWPSPGTDGSRPLGGPRRAVLAVLGARPAPPQTGCF